MADHKRVEQALQESEERFRKIFEHSNDAIFVVDLADEKIIDCNSKASAMLGFSRQELLARRMSDIHAHETPKLMSFAQTVLAKGQGWTHELCCLTKAGVYLPAEISASIFNMTGKDFMLAMVRDISERKRAEEDRQKLVALIENSPDLIGFGTMDRPPKPVYINPAGLKMLGFDTLEEAVSHSVLDFHPEDEQKRYMQVVIPALLEQGHWEGETCFRHAKTGARIPIHRHLFTVNDPHTGEPIVTATIVRDITALKRTQEELKKANDELEQRVKERTAELAQANEILREQIAERKRQSAAMETAMDGIAILSQDDAYVYMNDAHAKIYGYDSPKDLLGKTWRVLYRQDEIKRIEQEIMPILSEKGRWQGEVIGKRREGSTFDTEISLTAIAEGGLICVCRDISARKRAEEALRESEEKFRSLVENAPDFIAIVDSGGKILFINRTAPGFTIDEVIGTSVLDYISTEHHDLIRKSIKRVFHTGKPDAFEMIAKGPHGSTSWYSTRVGPIKRDGQIFALTLISTDITERRQAEQELRKLASIVEHTESGVATSSGDAFELVNPAFARMHGYAVEELIGMPIAHTFAPEYRAQVPENISAIKERGWLTFEAPHLRKDGSVFPALIQVTAVRDERGRPLYRIATVIDITERKRAEDQLRRYTKRLENLQEIDRAVLAARSPEKIAQAALHYIQDLMPCFRTSVVVFDFETKEGVVMATQVRRETKIGTGARWPMTAFELVETLEQGKPVVVDDLLRRPLSPIMKALKEEGIRSYINVPLISKGEFIGTFNLASEKPGAFSNEDVEIAREIANSLAIAIQQARLHEQVQRHAVELEQRVAERTAELEAFSYSVSHDLRSPLRAIDGFSRILQEDHAGMLDAECNRLLSIIRSNTQNMAQLIDDLLAFSRIGRKELQRTEVDMTELAKAVWEELNAATPGRVLHVKIMPLPVAHGDRAMLRQVFVNLLANAIKFTRSRETAMIEVGAGVEGNENVYYVKDNGVGFAMEYVHKLFGVFQRLHGAEEFEGTGVGLAIVQRIIQRHGGRVWAKGKVDEGAALHFTLPSKGTKL